jgi:hypothetical protein
MKKLILGFILCSVFPILVISSNPAAVRNTKPIFSKILEEEGIDSYNVPVFILKFALSFSEDSKSILPLFKGSHSVSIAICEKHERYYSDSFKRVCRSLDSSSYCDLVKIVDAKSKITIKALLVDNIIRELVVLINDSNDFVAVSMTGKIDPKSIANAITELNKPKEHEL